MSGATDTVDFTLLDETGPGDILLFGCKQCPGKKLTSHQIESHTVTVHGAAKLTVDSRTAVRSSRAKKATV